MLKSAVVVAVPRLRAFSRGTTGQMVVLEEATRS